MTKSKSPKRKPALGENYDDGAFQSIEDRANAIDDTTLTEGDEHYTGGWNSLEECIEAIDRHVFHTHGLTVDKEFLQKIGKFLRGREDS